MSDKKLEDKVAIVTGGASGIGEGICHEFAVQGARVVIADKNEEGGKSVAQEIGKRGGAATVVKVDVTDPESVARAVESIVERLGTIDILVNNAGWNLLKPAPEYTLEDWEKIRSLNLDGPWHVSKAVMPVLIRNGRGKIVNISSGSGILAQPNMSVYGAAKHGLVGMTKTLAVDLARYKINVNCICPATVETPLAAKSVSQAYLDFQVQRIPMGRLGTVSDIARRPCSSSRAIPIGSRAPSCRSTVA